MTDDQLGLVEKVNGAAADDGADDGSDKDLDNAESDATDDDSDDELDQFFDLKMTMDLLKCTIKNEDVTKEFKDLL